MRLTSQSFNIPLQLPEGPPQRPVRVFGRHHGHRRPHQAVQIRGETCWKSIYLNPNHDYC